MGLQTANWIFNILRIIFACLDWVVYGLIKLVVMGIFDLSELTTASGLLSDIYTRIYVLLGVFMAFKLSFSFIQYIINPDSMSEKNEKGVNKLIINTIVMIIALVSLPGILFGNSSGEGLLRRAQDAFLPMLPRVILGISEDSGVSIGNGNNTDDVVKSAETISSTTMQAFFSPSEEIDAYCGEGTYKDTPKINSIDEFWANVNMTCNNKNKSEGGAPKYYRYSYLFGVSTVVGILIVFMFAGIGIDVAKRIFKMLILELIAPIPIMSLIDPKSSKDGAFSHWLKTLISTFIDIFLKIGLLYLVLVLLNMITTTKDLFVTSPNLENQPVRNAILYIFLVVGLIFFAKEAPKFIKGAFGIKDNGEKSMFGAAGLAVGGLAGGALGAIGGLAGGGGFSGMVSGALGGAVQGSKPGKNGAPSVSGIYGKIRDEQAKALGRTPGGFIGKAQASLQGRSAERRLNKWGATVDDMQFAKDKMYETSDVAATAKDVYDRFLDGKLSSAEMTQITTRLGTTDFGAIQQHLYQDYTSKESAAGKAKSKYEKISKARETLGRDKDLNRQYNPGYRARRELNRDVDRRNQLRDDIVGPGMSKYKESHHTKGSDNLTSGPV